ncbi:hypothetical protein Pan189_03520 [Stratiformator vulcanicus]|uniref:Uncharacterized protein n=1 Tax=Stratiformator vulcanicus TaxID=2527980 RepID=A0A517QWN0_9PLAN|nr:hypothetical protein Pan189_03520 [Stratiformator vulcanicus]
MRLVLLAASVHSYLIQFLVDQIMITGKLVGDAMSKSR